MDVSDRSVVDGLLDPAGQVIRGPRRSTDEIKPVGSLLSEADLSRCASCAELP